MRKIELLINLTIKNYDPNVIRSGYKYKQTNTDIVRMQYYDYNYTSGNINNEYKYSCNQVYIHFIHDL